MLFDYSRLSLRPFTLEALEQSYQWLHDPEIKEMAMSPDFSKAEQLAWFNSLPARSDYITKALYADDEMIGAWGLKKINIKESHAEQFYYIGNKDYWGQSIGMWLNDRSFETCKELGISRLIAILLVKNIRVVNLHFKQGFKIKKYERDLYYVERIIK